MASRRIGITTTVPVEFVFAAGAVPVDLNNRFITDAEPVRMLDETEFDGWPRSICAWIKGIYAAARREQGLEAVIAVTRGDCSNAEALMDVFENEGLPVISFAYPEAGDRAGMERSMRGLAERLGADWPEGLAWKERLDGIRRKALRIDELTWSDGCRVSGLENHLALIGCSDFDSDPDAYESGLDTLLEEVSTRPPAPARGPRIGLMGVPTIVPAIYGQAESAGAKVVFNETQRQFAMPDMEPDIIDQYLSYTYPYRLAGRMADVEREIGRRSIDGLIHYVQSFCHRQIEDRIVRKGMSVPVLTLEADRPGPAAGALSMRLENFIAMLS